jgi:uncharacterized membrane protein
MSSSTMQTVQKRMVATMHTVSSSTAVVGIQQVLLLQMIALMLHMFLAMVVLMHVKHAAGRKHTFGSVQRVHSFNVSDSIALFT